MTDTKGLDRWLMHPVRLLIVAFLADQQWRDFSDVCTAVDAPSSSVTHHLSRLRASRYVESQREDRKSKIRLTRTGCERLTEHVTAMQAVTEQAAEFIAGAVESVNRKGTSST